MLEAESIPGPQCDWKDFMSTKNPLTTGGIELATFRIVVQHLKHCATVVPLLIIYYIVFFTLLQNVPKKKWLER